MKLNKRLYIIALIPIVMLITAVTQYSRDDSCSDVTLFPATVEGQYPAHKFSPKEARDAYDYVFSGEVLVPTRKCSLGFCAGIKIIQPIKGKVPSKNLIRIAHTDKQCIPSIFAHKGLRWLIFASSGTTKMGTTYMQVEADGPSYPTRLLPNFEVLEQRYQILKTDLELAIKQRLQATR
jgi:hypothetical protein